MLMGPQAKLLGARTNARVCAGHSPQHDAWIVVNRLQKIAQRACVCSKIVQRRIKIILRTGATRHQEFADATKSRAPLRRPPPRSKSGFEQSQDVFRQCAPTPGDARADRLRGSAAHSIQRGALSHIGGCWR